MPRTLAITLAAITVGGLLTACQDTTPGTPTPQGSSAADDGIDPALKVPRPLPTDQLLNDPCAVLSAAQKTSLGTVQSGDLDDRNPKACSWNSTATTFNSVGVGALPQNKRGITDIYAGKPHAAYFQPTTVNGYPAAYSAVVDDRSQGNCQLWTGVTDQLAFSVVTIIHVGENKAKTCDFAAKVSAAVLDHLSGKA